jgi:hypothetical protein
MHVERQVRRRHEGLVSDPFDRFIDWEHAVGLPELLFVGAEGSDPFGNVALLLLVQRELRCPLLTIALVPLAQIRAEPAMRLGGHVLRATEIGGDVKEETALI